MKVLLVSSPGGHLAQLYRLRPWWERHERTWVTFDKADAVSLLRDEDVRWGHHPTTRNLPNLLRNLWLAARLLSRSRPHLIVSSGAGVALPFFVLGRLLGCRTVYIEVYDRIDSATLTGRLCAPFTDLFLLQWEEQKKMYPRGVVLGPLL
ncbi:PssD/Cps14F family polysaccharide biosynthesis glycosyltransferase [Actinocorallia sp. B10E7]|uniref:PssD/Cps14F family polysaccharide biosynthesis glycosyltransferase n=1 Tax=Actinocorallia sp. B10E7 TaxID=3153558 RepID=UPI00325E0ACF